MIALETSHPALYAAFKAKDARFDGRFFVGVASTGIYCRPVCKARMPRPENCRFFETAAQAEQAGFRPCLLCRPEQAPGAAPADASSDLARRAALLLEAQCHSGLSLDALARQLGCTSRHVRRVFAECYHVSPAAYLQTCRLLLAKSLLTDTNLPVLQVAMAAGFGSLRRFNALFKSRYRLSPTALRKTARRGTSGEAGIRVGLGYRPPYRFEEMLAFLAGRAIPGVEAVREDAYLRTVRLLGPSGPVYGWLRVEHNPRRHLLDVTLSPALLPVLPEALARVRHLFDLGCEPQIIYEGLQGMNALCPGLAVPGRRVPGSFDPFEMAVRAVLGQQITVKAARTLATRLTEAFGTAVETGIAGLTHVFPSPADIVALEGPIEGHLGPLGVIGTRARTIRALAEALEGGAVDLSLGACPETQMKGLLALPGIGGWTAQYIAMRALGWPDAFLETDAGVKKALAPRTAKEMLLMAESWRPWRSYAVLNLWHAPTTNAT